MEDQEGDVAGSSIGNLADLEHDERYRQLVKHRSRFAWLLTALMLVIYFGYILLIAFQREFLARPIGDGVTSLGIPLGIGVILAGIGLTAIYVSYANRIFDPQLEALRREHGV